MSKLLSEGLLYHIENDLPIRAVSYTHLRAHET